MVKLTHSAWFLDGQLVGSYHQCTTLCESCCLDNVCHHVFEIRILYLRNFDQLIPDAPELILNYLEGEQDASCKRNAFMMLTHVDRVSVSLYV